MNTKPIPVEDEIVACAVCFEEIPVSEARSAEASDYVHHFCGLECFAKWQAQEEQPAVAADASDD